MSEMLGDVALTEGRGPCPINGLTFAPEWVGTNIFLKSQPVIDCTDTLYDEERAVVAAAAPIRRNTFSSGRRVARAVMQEAGLPISALPKAADGSVVWPEGLLGSITHTNDWAVAAVAVAEMCEAKSLGIDLERIKPFDEGVSRMIATPVEMQELALSHSPAWYATALFSMKESIYKCLASDFGEFIAFQDVEITNLAGGRPSYQRSSLELRLAVTPWHVFTLAWFHNTESC